jgi:alkanesulfonate monooxygenase SsuD/methylene tetrahydromethanopterin reductase-like flavin-dependent oxidoreductase (luciferase family)
MSAALGTATSTIRVGTAVMLAPLHEPIRFAEDAAVADLICDGRFELGLGQGFVPIDFETFRPAKGTRVRHLEDTVATLRQAWSGSPVTGGSLFSYPRVSVNPQPEQREGPPIWLGGTTEEAIRRSGRLADGYVATYVTDPDVLAQQFEWVQAGRAEADPGCREFRYAVSSLVFVWPDCAWETVREYVHYLMWKYDDFLHPVDPARHKETLPAPGSQAEHRLRENIICGDTETVASALRDLEDKAGVELEVVTRMYFPGMDSGMQRETLEMFASDVAPALRSGQSRAHG